jgi:hypothetical protein
MAINKNLINWAEGCCAEIAEPVRKSGPIKKFDCGDARCMAGSKTATGPLTVSVVEYIERAILGYTCTLQPRNAVLSVSISSNAGDEECSISDS